MFSFFIIFVFMKQEIFKRNFEKYESVRYRTFNSVKESHLGSEKHPFFNFDASFKDEKTFVENFGNPLFSVSKEYYMVVVEKDEDKVSIKRFYGLKHRKGGNSWFKIVKNMSFISVNKKTGDVYVGSMENYQKKRKCVKKIRKNSFLDNHLSSFQSILKNTLTHFTTEENFNISSLAIQAFINEVDGQTNFSNLSFDSRLFKFYLDKKQIKYPNNFNVYSTHLLGTPFRKLLKKENNRLVEAFMIFNNLKGKKLKLALHTCDYINLQNYFVAKNLFGEDWINQDGNIISEIISQKTTISVSNQMIDEFKNLVSVEEMKRVYKLFKQSAVDQRLDSWTFVDHIRMYTELKRFGEVDLKWMSSDDSQDEFRKEHLDWTDKLDHYKKGTYTRIYPQYMIDELNKPYTINGVTYHPILLTNSNLYNAESAIQSNCVKGYIGRPSSFIISLRKDDVDSGERATIEYRLKYSKDKEDILCERIQTLGKHNRPLGEEWNDTLANLDQQVFSYIKDKRFETVKITKVCKNGITLESDSEWDDYGNLQWSYKPIDNNNFYNNFFI